MLQADGWFDWTVRDPGPDARWANFGYAKTPVVAIYHHSLEGWFYPVNSNGHNEMKNPLRFPTAWHWSNVRRVTPYNGINYPIGTVFQHYPVWARLQHGNGGNVLGPGGETEGLFTMPLLSEQVESWRRIHYDISQFYGREFPRIPGNGRTGLCEHREAPGAQTACPSERYAPLWAAVAGGDGLSAEESKLLQKMLKQGWGSEERLDELLANFSSLDARIASREADHEDDLVSLGKLDDHIANHPGGDSSVSAPHDHPFTGRTGES